MNQNSVNTHTHTLYIKKHTLIPNPPTNNICDLIMYRLPFKKYPKTLQFLIS